MKFAREGLKLEFLKRLHVNTRRMAFAFDLWCKAEGMGDAIVTDISRPLDFYKKNKLPEPLFSWHFVDCAVDFANKHLTEVQQDKCKVWLLEHCRGSEWELVLREHGTGPHFHAAYKSYDLRKQFNKPKEIANV